MADATMPLSDRDWWRTAVIYEVYPRSFQDANGDGDGDLPGLRSRLPYLADLGVDGIWIAPWYPSPMADGGYDVSDYLGIAPMFGTLQDADAVVQAAHALGLRVIVDMVANHTSEQHPWFLSALRSAPGSPARARYGFRDGRGPGGDLPPNNWVSAFGGPAWTRVTEPDGTPGQWYLHTFAPEQPDLDWRNPEVQAAFDEVLRFWFDRGIDGLRVDAAPAFGKAEGLPDADYHGDLRFRTLEWVDNPQWDDPHAHEVFRRWRRVAEEYGGDRIFVAEAVVNGTDRLAAYLRDDELHTAFNFPYLKSAWSAEALREVVDQTLDQFSPIGVPSTWALESHDEVRIATRFGRVTTSAVEASDGEGEPSDLALGTRRAAAAVLLMLALPGGAYLYQGQELGLPQVELPDELLQDPLFVRSGGTQRGRDGGRVPMPWSGETPPFGFSSPGTRTWLPQPADWVRYTVEAERLDPDSLYTLVRTALRLRRERFTDEAFGWLAAPGGVLAFRRTGGVRVVVNLGAAPVPVEGDLLLASAPLVDGHLPVDAAVWLQA